MTEQTRAFISNVEPLNGALLVSAATNDYGSVELVASKPDLWGAGTPMEFAVPLYVTKFGTSEIDPERVANLQIALRASLHDNSINFNIPVNPADPYDLINWSASHPNVPIELENYESQNGSKVRVANIPETEHDGSNSRFGQSAFLPKYDPSKHASYDKDRMLVNFFDAQSPQHQADIQIKNGESIVTRQSSNGTTYTYFEGTGVIDRVIFTGTESFTNRGKAQPKTLLEAIDAIGRYVVNDPQNAQIASTLANYRTNPTIGWTDVLDLVGGAKAYNVQGSIRAAVVDELEQIDSIVMTFYIRTDEDKLFQMSTATLRQNNARLHIEYLPTDFRSSDIYRPLAASNFINLEEGARVAKEQGVFVEGKGIVFPSTVEALTWLNTLLAGRGISYESDLSNGDTSRMGSRLRAITGHVETPVKNNTEVAAPTFVPQTNDVAPDYSAFDRLVNEPVTPVQPTTTPLASPFAEPVAFAQATTQGDK